MGREVMRTFSTGATRNNDPDRLEFNGFLSPLTTLRFAQYMHKHRFQADGAIRGPANWQRGMPRLEYLGSLLRHVWDVWLILVGRDGFARTQDLEEALCGAWFNVQGLLLEALLDRDLPAKERE